MCLLHSEHIYYKIINAKQKRDFRNFRRKIKLCEWKPKHTTTYCIDTKYTHLLFSTPYYAKRAMLVQKTHKHTTHSDSMCRLRFMIYALWILSYLFESFQSYILFMHSKICDTPSHLNHSFSTFFLSFSSFALLRFACIDMCAGKASFNRLMRIVRALLGVMCIPYAHSILSICALDEAFNRSCGLRKLFKWQMPHVEEKWF